MDVIPIADRQSNGGQWSFRGRVGRTNCLRSESVGETYLKDIKEKNYGFLNYLELKGNL